MARQGDYVAVRVQAQRDDADHRGQHRIRVGHQFLPAGAEAFVDAAIRVEPDQAAFLPPGPR
jgi:hypothetical protein